MLYAGHVNIATRYSKNVCLQNTFRSTVLKTLVNLLTLYNSFYLRYMCSRVLFLIIRLLLSKMQWIFHFVCFQIIKLCDNCKTHTILLVDIFVRNM